MAKILIDAGHFGKYNRSPVLATYYESERMWLLSQLVGKALGKLGHHVVMTRTNQAKDLALISRGKKAKGCDVAISFHSNAASSATVDYVVSLVMRENSRTDIDDKSEEIGLLLAREVAKVMGTKQTARTATRASGNDRDGNGLKDDEYYGFLQGAKQVGVPALILEHSFHTNLAATKFLMDDANLAKLAEAEARVLDKWLGGNAGTSPSAKPDSGASTAVKIEGAQAKDIKLKKTYAVTAVSGLHLRSGAGKGKTSLAVLPRGTKVTCYGYYTMVGKVRWLYLSVTDSKSKYKGMTGYCSQEFLK